MTDPLLVHAALMCAAWLLLLPSGAMIARFCKVTRRQDWPRVVDNQLWWRLHRVLQYAGIGCALAGFVVAWRATGGLDASLLHVQVGLFVLSLALLQVASTWFRGNKGGPTGDGADPQRPETWRGDHYDMTRRRRAFEAWHKTAGWVSMPVALLAVLLGLRLYGWPQAICILALSLVAVQVMLFARLSRSSRRIGTYQAIWGPDPSHPGNRGTARDCQPGAGTGKSGS